MTASDDPLLLPAESEFGIGTSDLAFYEAYAGRCHAGAVLFCRRGSAQLTIDGYTGTIRRHAALFLLPGLFFSISHRSANFSVDYFVFSPQFFAEAGYPLDFDFLRILKEHPVMQFSANGVKGMNMWFAILTYDIERGGRFCAAIVKNRLQNALMSLCDHVMQQPDLRQSRPADHTTRQGQLFERFMQLVKQHGGQEREVAFYADQLCISTRYLSTIAHAMSGHTAKEIIDNQVILEIKFLLQKSSYSIQEIAYRLHFPDQSYLGRFFRKHTGLSPSQFRKNGK